MFIELCLHKNSFFLNFFVELVFKMRYTIEEKINKKEKHL